MTSTAASALRPRLSSAIHDIAKILALCCLKRSTHLYCQEQVQQDLHVTRSEFMS